MADTPPLDPRTKRRLSRTGIPQSIVRQARASQPTTASKPTEIPARATEALATMSDDSDDGDDAPRTITTSVFVHTYGGEMAKRPRPSTSSSGGSDEQEDKRVKLTQLALSGPNPNISKTQSGVSLLQPTLPQPGSPLRKDKPGSSAALDSASLPMTTQVSRSHDPSSLQSETPHESASWAKDSTSYAGIASPVLDDVPMRPVSPQPGTSYAATAAAPASPRRTPQATAPPHAAPTDPAPRSAYPPLVVERLPNWTRHFEAIGGILGHAPNARPLGGGVRFLPKSAEEFRAVQRYLTSAAAQDSTISWYCYSPADEIPTKVAIRGLPLDTPTEAVIAALRALGFPAEAARAIPPPRGKHGCTYFVRLAHMSQEELRILYTTTELLYMPQILIEAWRGGHKPPQCFRCQLYSHSSTNCHRPVRCVRCAGEHFVQDCPRPSDEPTCANCGQGHSANDRRCTYYKREARRRGIAQPPPPPRAQRAKQRQRLLQRANTAAAQPDAPTTTQWERYAGAASGATASSAAAPPSTGTASRSAETRSAGGANPRATEPRAYGATDPCSAATRASAPRPAEPRSAGTDDPRATEPRATDPRSFEPRAAVTHQATRPTTLMADANPPINRGNTRGRKRRRAPRPARAEPAAASTPQQRQPRSDAPVGPNVVPRDEPATAPNQHPQPAPQMHIRAPTNQQPASQGEAQTNPDFTAIIRVVVEAVTASCIAYLQGQGILQVLAAGMAVLTRPRTY